MYSDVGYAVVIDTMPRRENPAVENVAQECRRECGGLVPELERGEGAAIVLRHDPDR